MSDEPDVETADERQWVAVGYDRVDITGWLDDKSAYVLGSPAEARIVWARSRQEAIATAFSTTGTYDAFPLPEGLKAQVWTLAPEEEAA